MENEPHKPSVSATDTSCHAESHGTAPAFNIVLGAEMMRPFAWFAGAVLAVNLLASVAAISIAIWAAVETSLFNANVQRQMHALDTDARLAAYWGERAEVAMTAKGVSVPPYPTRNPKEKHP